MGDRANVHIPTSATPGEGVYLYTHWGGYDLPHDVQTALAKKWRWDDGPYLARIIFDQMTVNDHGKETGFGIWTSICDNEHPIVVVNPETQTVQFVPARWDQPPQWATGPSWSFKDYIALSEKTLSAAYTGRDEDDE